jgi:hypothetical protein
MTIKFINQVTKRLNALWNTSLQLSPGEITEGPISLVNDIGNDLKRTFQGSIYLSITIPAGGSAIARADIIAALHESIPTLGNAPARFILDRDDIEFIKISDFFMGARVTATPGETYGFTYGVQFTTTTGPFLDKGDPYISTSLITGGGGTIRYNSGVTHPELKKSSIVLSSDQISSSTAGGLPMPEYLAPFIVVVPPGVMGAPAVVEFHFTYQIELVYKRPYQAIRNNSRALTSF